MAPGQLSLSLKQPTKWIQPNESLTVFKILKGMYCELFINFQLWTRHIYTQQQAYRKYVLYKIWVYVSCWHMYYSFLSSFGHFESLHSREFFCLVRPFTRMCFLLNYLHYSTNYYGIWLAILDFYMATLNLPNNLCCSVYLTTLCNVYRFIQYRTSEHLWIGKDVERPNRAYINVVF
jgi:hypothetical protein